MGKHDWFRRNSNYTQGGLGESIAFRMGREVVALCVYGIREG